MRTELRRNYDEREGSRRYGKNTKINLLPCLQASYTRTIVATGTEEKNEPKRKRLKPNKCNVIIVVVTRSVKREYTTLYDGQNRSRIRQNLGADQVIIISGGIVRNSEMYHSVSGRR